MKKYLMTVFLFSFLFLVLVNSASAIETTVLKPRFGHVLYISYDGMEPSPVAPGSTAIMSFTIKNTATEFIRDLRININLPYQLAPYNDIVQRRITMMEAGESQVINFNVVALPSAAEGIYNATLEASYLNSIGYERQDNGTISLMIGGTPKIFVTIESSEIYKGNNIGDVDILLVNNEIADVRFLTVELMPSMDYDIIGPNREYVGDLDSDDFETVDFRLNVKTKEDSVVLPLFLTYRDALNREYEEEVDLVLVMRSPEELGIASNNTALIIVSLVVVAIIAYVVYRKYVKKNDKRLS